MQPLSDSVERWLINSAMQLLALSALLIFCFGSSVGATGQSSLDAGQYAERGLHYAEAGELGKAEEDLRRAVKLAPNNPEFVAELGGILGLEHKLEESLLYLEKAVSLDPQNDMARRNLASSQWQLGRLEEAKANLEVVLKAKPADPPTVLLLGMVEENLKAYEKSARLLGSVRALVNQRPESIAALARSYYRIGEKQKAREILEALLIHPTGSSGVFLGGQVAADADDYETAEKLFTSIRSSYPNTAALGYNLAFVQYHTGRFEEGRKTLLDLVEAGYGSSDIYNLLAWCYRKQGKTKEAIQEFEQAIDRDPQRESNYLDLGMVLVEHKRFPAAYELTKMGVHVLPNSANIYKLKGLIELKLQFFKDAIASYSQASELDPSSSDAQLGLAVAQWNSGLVSDAVRTFDRGLERFPRDPSHYTEYARMILKTADPGDSAAESRAVSLLQSAIALDPKQAEPHYQLANFLLDKGKAEDALHELQIAAELDPNSSKVHYTLARTYRRLGRKQESAREFKIYRRLAEVDETASSLSPAGMHP